MTERGFPYRPDYAVPPGWVLEERIEVLGISPARLPESCGLSLQQVRGILAGEVHVGPEVAAVLSETVGLEAEIWLGIESDYRAALTTPRS